MTRIDPASLAFDIDGVVADTMEVFARLARERFGLSGFTKEQIVTYDLSRCVPVAEETLRELVCLTLDDEHTLAVPPMPGAPEVLTALSRRGPLRFVTARIWPESITRWLHLTLPGVAPSSIEVIATGDPGAKTEVLLRLGVTHFVDDRAETCELLAAGGIEPILFDQPWNRAEARFRRVRAWREIHEAVFGPGAAPENGRRKKSA